jgi:glucose-1-phosphate thymidylyltransferase
MVKAIILCAGYATRLGELGERCAKPLLDIGGRPIIEYIMDKVNEIDDVDDIIVVSNGKFYDDFVKWKDNSEHVRVKILNNGSTSVDNARGALRDLEYALDEEDIDDDVLVLAGDNLIEFSLSDFYDGFKNIGNNLIAIYDIEDIEKVRNRHGVAVLDGNRVVEFQEKPSYPKSTMKSICCYLFKPGFGNLLKRYLQKGNPDATGFFMERFCNDVEVYSHNVGRGNVYDIGNLEGLGKVRERFS